MRASASRKKVMSKKSIIICIVITAVFIAAVTVALSILYSDQNENSPSMYESKEYGLLAAVPSDALFVLKTSSLSDCMDALDPENSILGQLVGTKARKSKFMSFLDTLAASPGIDSDAAAVVSGHHIGTITPLMILDAGKAGDEMSEGIRRIADAAGRSGLYSSYVDVSECTGGDNWLKRRSVLMVSPSDILIQSSERHLKRSVSVLDSEGMAESLSRISGRSVLIFPNADISRLISENMVRRYRSDAGFLSEFSECAAFGISTCTENSLSLAGVPAAGQDPRNFINVYRDINPSLPKVSGVIPSYTIFAATLPLDDVSSYHTSYMKFAETRALSRKLEENRKQLFRTSGTDPVVWAKSLDFKEVATAVFRSGASLEKILLMRLGNVDKDLIFKGLGEEEIKAGSEGIMPYRYQGFIPVLFGDLFRIKDESSFILRNGWMIVGSANALKEYVSGRATGYTLSEYVSDAGVEDRLARKDSYFSAYYSVSEYPELADSLFSKSFAESLKKSLDGISYEPVFLNVCEGRSGMNILFDIERTVVLKSKAPAFERDTTVVVPEGPFRVKNSGTGKMNLFYQQKNLYLCLQEEGGKGLWGVPFTSPICGCAQTVDYFANGKLQILFGAGSKLYLIDRLGRFVNPFPVELGKEILIGPDVYDFSGKRRYNVMVLHKDNTIEMYNLQGKKPAAWKGIAPSETITGLPERIDLGSNTYWIVRTSIQTLIYDFYGGDPLTVYEGDRMIRRDSKVVPVGGDSVEVTCYDGKQHTIKL